MTNDDAGQIAHDAKDAAEREKQWWLQQTARRAEEFIALDNLVYGGLIAIGVVMVQPFLTAKSLDLSAKISVGAFSIAIPLLAALVMVNRQEIFRRRATTSTVVKIAKPVAQACAFAGVVAGFWHIMPLAGAGVLVSGVLGMAVHSAGYVQLEKDGGALEQGTEDPGEPTS